MRLLKADAPEASTTNEIANMAPTINPVSTLEMVGLEVELLVDVDEFRLETIVVPELVDV